MTEHAPEHIETVIVGGGQAGLSVGHHLARQGRPFLILDADQRVGDAWRKRWDSLRLFTPARYDALAGMPFPAPAHSFPPRTTWPLGRLPQPFPAPGRRRPRGGRWQLGS
ncbi:MAG TPA: NAD(P)-binding protein [Actinomycetes bacterium]|nr:NAD(P)-binding protein [Actinomycetes bacterium]